MGSISTVSRRLRPRRSSERCCLEELPVPFREGELEFMEFILADKALGVVGMACGGLNILVERLLFEVRAS